MTTLLPKATEREIQGAILHLLAAEHIFAIRLNTFATTDRGRVLRSHSGGAGVADILAFPRELMPLWIEVKSATGKQSPEQKNFQLHVEEYGHTYLLARAPEDVIVWLRATPRPVRLASFLRGLRSGKLFA
jgi:hypothetical protein